MQPLETKHARKEQRERLRASAREPSHLRINRLSRNATNQPREVGGEN
jgi:hypothetical protein